MTFASGNVEPAFDDDDEEYVEDDKGPAPPGTEYISHKIFPDMEDMNVKKQQPVNEIPRPLQLNQEYDEWSSAMAPPVFTDKE